MSKSKLKSYNPTRPIILKNKTCVYCGVHLENNNWNRDHVIGRKFVPKGKLENEWNLIARSCISCNNIKSDLENDISAITMQPNLDGAFVDVEVETDAIRKRKNSISRLTGKKIINSYMKFNGNFEYTPGVNFKFHFNAPPQIASSRVFQLARMHVMAFFYLTSYSEETGKGGFWRGKFAPVLYSSKNDWGSYLFEDFMNKVESWEPILLLRGDYLFFQVAIRKNPIMDCWSWALEWNRNYRVIGFFGIESKIKDTWKNFRKLPITHIGRNEHGPVSMHIEKPLDSSKDKMFQWNAETNN